MDIHNLVSFAGIFVFAGLGWLFSNNRKIINWKTVFVGIGLQLVFAAIIFWLPFGVTAFSWINGAVNKLFVFAKDGIIFLFGPLAESSGEHSVGFVLAIQSLPTVIFFAALMSLLYYLKLMQWCVSFFSRIFTKFMGLSGAESLSTASNIFVGVESSIVVKPYLEKMTRSELCVIITAGMATIASTVLAFYASILNSVFPAIAGHMVSASIIGVPAAIVMSKLLYPEDGKPLTMGVDVKGEFTQATSWIESIIQGANDGVKLLVGICALLIAFLGLAAMINYFLSIAGLSIQKIFSYIFQPLVFFTGVPLKDVPTVSYLLGERVILTELVAYQHLAQYIKDGVVCDPRTVLISSYALCGFAHIASLAIFVGGTAALAPSRAKDISGVGLRALAAATLACLMIGAISGIFFTQGSAILQLK